MLVSLSLLPLAIALREEAEEVTLIARIDRSRFNPKAIESLNGRVVYVAELAPHSYTKSS